METQNCCLDNLSPMDIANLLQRRADFYTARPELRQGNKKILARRNAYQTAADLIRREAEKG